MPSPPIEVFLTTIASQPALRQRQEYILRILQVKKIPFTSYDLASDEKAKRLWKRKAPQDKQQLPGILVGGRFPGVFTDFEDAVEYGELDTFLRLKETWDADIDGDGASAPPAMPIGVPGAQMPLDMTPEHVRAKIVAEHQASAASPLRGKGSGVIPANKRSDLFDVSTELSGFGLQGVEVSEKELLDLVAELGLDGDEAGDLVKGLSSATTTATKEVKSAPASAPPAKDQAELAPATWIKEEPVPAPATPAKEPAPVVKPAEDAVKVEEEPKVAEESKAESEDAKVTEELKTGEEPKPEVPQPSEALQSGSEPATAAEPLAATESVAAAKE